MRLLMLAAAALSTASGPVPAPAPTDAIARPMDWSRCRGRSDLHPANNQAPPRARRLGELPPGELRLTVLREVDGCPEPTIVRRGYGEGFDPPEPKRR